MSPRNGSSRSRIWKPLSLQRTSSPLSTPVPRSTASSGRRARPADRRTPAAARVHGRAREREGVRAARRPAHRPADRGRDRRQGPLGPGLRERLAADGVTLLTPDGKRTDANLGRERALASTRLVMESVFANVKGQADAARAAPRPNTRRARRPDRAANPRAHDRDAAQQPRWTTATSSRRLRRPLNHIKPLGTAPRHDGSRHTG